MFQPNSRYFSLADKKFVTEQGVEVTYKARRFLPKAGNLTTQGQVSVVDQDRMDRIAERSIADPLAYWRICDVNNAMNPNDLIKKPGHILAVPGIEI